MEKEKKELLELFKAYSRNILSSKENAKKFLIELGTHDKNGNLNENYK